jgi:hypothetical protein
VVAIAQQRSTAGERLCFWCHPSSTIEKIHGALSDKVHFRFGVAASMLVSCGYEFSSAQAI